MPTVVKPNYRPHEKQIALHTAPVSDTDVWVILYGGSRGGGKSAGILGDAVMFCLKYPGAKAVIFRERLDAVKQSFLDKLPNLFPQKVNGQMLYDYKEKSTGFYPSRCIIFPNGSYITLQRCADYREAKQFQGWEFNYMAIDEVTKQEERTVDYLMTCVRSAEITNPITGEQYHVPTKVVLSCNPGGIGHQWVKKRFIDRTVTEYNENGTPVKTKDVIEFVKKEKGDGVIKRFIRFIPASFRDNPYLNEGYIANLQSLTEWQRKMDLEGCWDVVAGSLFDFNDEMIIDHDDTIMKMEADSDYAKTYVSIDWGYKPSYYSAHWYQLLTDGTILCFQELYGQELVFEEFVNQIKDMSEGFYIETTCLPHDMFRHGDLYRDEGGRVIGEVKADVFGEADLNPLPVESGHGKVQMRYDKIHSMLHSLLKNGEYKLRISEDCPRLIEELRQAVRDDNNPEVIAPKCKDHAIDDLGLFLVFYTNDYNPEQPEHEKEEKKLSWLEKKLRDDEMSLRNEESFCITSIDY